MTDAVFVPDWAQQAALLDGSMEGVPGARSISDDDLCAWCSSLLYCPGELSLCQRGWPGVSDDDGYVQACEQLALIRR